jgi:hypothetical protein
MSNIIFLDKNFSTTRLLIQEKLVIVDNPKENCTINLQKLNIK